MPGALRGGLALATSGLPWSPPRANSRLGRLPTPLPSPVGGPRDRQAASLVHCVLGGWGDCGLEVALVPLKDVATAGSPPRGGTTPCPLLG